MAFNVLARTFLLLIKRVVFPALKVARHIYKVFEKKVHFNLYSHEKLTVWDNSNLKIQINVLFFQENLDRKAQ